MSTELETSYGGVVLRGDELLVITPAGKRVTGLPKGGMEAGETPEQVAAREVREETGVVANVIEPLGDVRYTYRRDGRLIAKRVRFFLFEFRSGSIADHDHEIEDARWVPLEQAVSELTYPGERDMVSRVLSRARADR